MKILTPAGLAEPRGYAHGVSCDGTIIFVSGQIGWNDDRSFTATDIAGQVRQALTNIVRILAAASARPHHIARMTWYVTDKRAYLAAQNDIGVAYREVIGRHYPAMSVVEVRALLEDAALVEIEATAVVPR
jgi:enamine deaminase RidA (YjgF/YER057c/UK114 family)